MEVKNFEDLRKHAPDNEEESWSIGDSKFTREETASLVWTQFAMISNDIKIIAFRNCKCFEDLPLDIQSILNYLDNPRVPNF